jgi:hypothetical protein
MPWPKHCWRPEIVNGTGGSQWCRAVAKRSSCVLLRSRDYRLFCRVSLTYVSGGSAHLTCKLVSVPDLFWRGRRKNLDAVNRLDDLFQGMCSVHGLRFSRLVQPAKRVRKGRAIRFLLGDLARKLPNFRTSHSWHVVRSLADECQPDEAEDSQRVLSGVQDRAGDGVDAPALVSVCSRLSARASCCSAFSASRAFRAGVVALAANRLYRAASRWWNSTNSDFRTTMHPQNKARGTPVQSLARLLPGEWTAEHGDQHSLTCGVPADRN